MTGRAAEAARPRRGDRGNAALELVILAPVIVLLIGMVVAAGRTTIAQGSIDAAARDAARQASSPGRPPTPRRRRRTAPARSCPGRT